MSDFTFSDCSQWITAPEAVGKKNCFVRFYHAFELKDTPESLEILITAESYYLLWVNGLIVGNGPIRGTVRLHYFDVYDIACHLRQGVNHLAVLCHNPNAENFVASPGFDAPALRLEIPGVVGSGSHFRAQLAMDYLNTEELFCVQTGFMEDRLMALAPDDRLWTRGVGGSAQWAPAAAVEPRQVKELCLRDVPPTVRRPILPVNLVRSGSVVRTDNRNRELYKQIDSEIWSDCALDRLPGAATLYSNDQHCTVLPSDDDSGVGLILDLGQDYAGFTELEVECTSPGTFLAVSYGEYLLENGRFQLDFNNPSYGLTDRYILAEGLNCIGSKLCERGARYIQLLFHDLTAPVVIRKLRFIEHRYDFSDRGAFHCSDELLNRIWKCCVETLKCCTTDVFTDCPWRERSFWINDLLVENRTALTAFGAWELHRRAFKLAFSQQRRDGWLPGVCPAPQSADFQWVLPATNLFIFLMLDDYCMASGDKEYVLQYLDNLKLILQSVEQYRCSDGTVKAPRGAWNFYDWGFELHDKSFDGQHESMYNFLYCQALEIYEKFLRWAGRSSECEGLAEKRQQTLQSTYRVFLDPEKHLLQDDYRYYHYHENAPYTVGKLVSQLSHALAILYSDVPADCRESFAAAMADEHIVKPDLYLQSFILRAMHSIGHDRTALERIRNYWGPIVRDGSPTIYEIGLVKNGRGTPEGSMCHGFTSAPLEFFHTVLLGVEAVTPGFEQFRFDPRPVDLEFAEGRIPTPHGNICVKWQRKSGFLFVEILIPQNCSAILPDKQKLLSGPHRLRLAVQ